MVSQRLIQLLRFLQRVLLVFRRRSRIYLFSLHQKLFRGRPRSSTQSDGSRQDLRRLSIPRSFGWADGDGFTLTSCIRALDQNEHYCDLVEIYTEDALEHGAHLTRGGLLLIALMSGGDYNVGF